MKIKFFRDAGMNIPMYYILCNVQHVLFFNIKRNEEKKKKKERKMKSGIFLSRNQIFSFDIISSAGCGNGSLHV